MFLTITILKLISGDGWEVDGARKGGAAGF